MLVAGLKDVFCDMVIIYPLLTYSNFKPVNWR